MIDMQVSNEVAPCAFPTGPSVQLGKAMEEKGTCEIYLMINS